MLNQLVMVGRIVRDPELKELDDGKKLSNITIAVPRNFKNSEGIYDTDFIDCTLWGGMAENTAEYCKKGDMVGIKGRIQSTVIEHKEGYKTNKLQVVAERVTFLTQSKDKEQEKNIKDERA